jgi:ApbE superfamily uncharacterized protein (UPF0280 family)
MLDDRRLHLQDGPIDLIVEADGDTRAVRAAYAAAAARFATILDELCAELPLLRSHADPSRSPEGAIATKMWRAVLPFAPETFITPMAAVAGAVADEIMDEMLGARPRQSLPGRGGGAARGEVGGDGFNTEQRASLTRASVNNGGDIALHLSPGASWRIGLVDRPDRPSLFATTTLYAGDGIGGIATSGWRGRSFSLGIADAVTVLAATAAEADAAATVIANAVDLPGHPAVTRVPATDLQPDSDLGRRPVTRAVGPLASDDIAAALSAGAVRADDLIRRGLIASAALHLAGTTRVVEKSATVPQSFQELAHV